jgi:hypothetical protein
MSRRVPGVVMVILALSAFSGFTPALAQSSDGQATATIPVQQVVRSVTVSPNAVTYGNCTKGGASLTFPNDTCYAPPITVTNSGTAGHINVHGSDAVPSDNGTPWTLAPGSPGADQFTESLTGSTQGGATLSNTDSCDKAFDDFQASDCAAGPNQSQSESLYMTGPSSSTDSSSSFATTITWTAVP